MAKQRRTKKRRPDKALLLATMNAEFLAFDSEHDREHGAQCVTNIASPALNQAVVDQRRDWIVSVGVICRADDGSYYTEDADIIARNVRLNDLTEVYQQVRDEARAAVNPRHIVDAGWIARPYSRRLAARLEAGSYEGLLAVWLARQRVYLHRLEEARLGH